MITSRPPERITRFISLSPLSRSSKFLMPYATITASKVSDGRLRFIQSSFWNCMVASSCASFTFSFPTFIIPSERSTPKSFLGDSSLAARIAKSPVPVATSSICWGWYGRRESMAAFLHFLSIPNESAWLSKS